jgi:hypothetical protein
MKHTPALLMTLCAMVIGLMGCADSGGTSNESDTPVSSTTEETSSMAEIESDTPVSSTTEETSSVAESESDTPVINSTTAETSSVTESESPLHTAEMMIDPFIDQAIAAIESVKRDDLSDVTYPYEPPADSLDAADKAMYDEMLAKAKSLEPFAYTAEEHGYDEMDRSLRVYGAIARNHPAIENYFCMREIDQGVMTMTTEIKAHYFMPWDADMEEADITELRFEADLFDAVCDRIVQRMPEGLSAYDQYRYLAAVISFVTSYDYDFAYGWQDGTAYGAVLGGHSICQGYSRGFMALCQKANLWCEYAEGEFANTAHMWNLVKLDTGTYHIDITWSDEKGLPDSAEWARYFMLTQDEILIDHEVYSNTTATGTPVAAN